ncbi:MAG: hypothetical protein QM784_24560 [Polyangiaceae bacterium]
MRRTFLASIFTMGLSLFLGGCSSDDSSGGGSGGAGGAGGESAGGAGGSTDVKQVEIYSWWISPGEAEALQALVELHQDKHPEDRIFNAAKDSGATTRAELASKIDAGDPPDLFQGNAADLSAFLTAHPNTLEPLDDSVGSGWPRQGDHSRRHRRRYDRRQGLRHAGEHSSRKYAALQQANLR